MPVPRSRVAEADSTYTPEYNGSSQYYIRASDPSGIYSSISFTTGSSTSPDSNTPDDGYSEFAYPPSTSTPSPRDSSLYLAGIGSSSYVSLEGSLHISQLTLDSSRNNTLETINEQDPEGECVRVIYCKK
jgi:hypothetical protein